MPSKLTKRTIDALRAAPTRYVVWDSEVHGFGCRVSVEGNRTFFLKCRHEGRQRWITIGRYGSPWTVEMARQEALRLLTESIYGRDPTVKMPGRR